MSKKFLNLFSKGLKEIKKKQEIVSRNKKHSSLLFDMCLCDQEGVSCI